MILAGCGAIVVIFVSAFLIFEDDHDTYAEELDVGVNESVQDTTFYVDIKGAVKKPGVYEVYSGDKIIDAINLAGGLTKSANTSNINLAQSLKKEMVIYIFTNAEIKNNSSKSSCDTTCQMEVVEVNNCADNESSSAISGKVNINTASKEELMGIPNIGSSKADAIIEYRKTNKFMTIEDIMQVSGIGSSVFDKIKDYLTV